MIIYPSHFIYAGNENIWLLATILCQKVSFGYPVPVKAELFLSLNGSPSQTYICMSIWVCVY